MQTRSSRNYQETEQKKRTAHTTVAIAILCIDLRDEWKENPLNYDSYGIWIFFYRMDRNLFGLHTRRVEL